MEARDELTTRQKAHMAAVRRLLNGIVDYPEVARGLGKLAALHMTRADEIEAALARASSAATLGREVDRQSATG